MVCADSVSSDVLVRFAQFDPSRYASKRIAEKEASKNLIKEIFGSDAEIGHLPSGVPYIEGINGSLSISHSCNWVAIAFSKTETIGIDIQFTSSALTRVASRFLSVAEQTISNEQHLLLAWATKEAIFKAALNKNLVMSEIRLQPDFPNQGIAGALLADSEPGRFLIEYLPAPEPGACVALARKLP